MARMNATQLGTQLQKSKTKVSRNEVSTSERSRKIIAMRRAGYLYDEIAESVGVSIQYCCMVVKEYVNRCNTLTKEDAQLIRRLDLEKIETSIRILYNKILHKQDEPDPRLLSTLLDYLERKAKLQGLDQDKDKNNDDETEKQKAYCEISPDDLR